MFIWAGQQNDNLLGGCDRLSFLGILQWRKPMLAERLTDKLYLNGTSVKELYLKRPGEAAV